MSIAAAATANITHLPHTAHPISLREQAFTLHCQGLRSPAISAELGVPERTIRSWIAAALDELKDDLQLSRKEQLLLAVERQHQLTAAAWQQFNQEAAARDALLDAALQIILDAATHAATHATDNSSNAPTRPLHLHLPASTLAPRYLSLILQANKETNRLLGLHTLAKLQLLTPDDPATDPASLANSASAAESAPDSQIPAKAATAPSDNVDTDIPVEPATATPAKSATISHSSCSPFSSVSSVFNPRSLPAKTATVTTPGLAAGFAGSVSPPIMTA